MNVVAAYVRNCRIVEDAAFALTFAASVCDVGEIRGFFDDVDAVVVPDGCGGRFCPADIEAFASSKFATFDAPIGHSVGGGRFAPFDLDAWLEAWDDVERSSADRGDFASFVATPARRKWFSCLSRAVEALSSHGLEAWFVDGMPVGRSEMRIGLGYENRRSCVRLMNILPL